MNFEQKLLEDFNKSQQSKVVLTKDMEEQIINEVLESLHESLKTKAGMAASFVAGKVALAVGKTINGTRAVSRRLFRMDPYHPDYKPYNDPHHNDYNPNHPDFTGAKPNLFNNMISKAANTNGGQNSNGRFSYNSNMMQQLNQQNSMQ
jgi:predicted AlkP superfamily phosphohydrolase/phosphomutase